MAKSGKGDSKGRGENSGQGATSEAVSAPVGSNSPYQRLAAFKTLARHMAPVQEVEAGIIVHAMQTLVRKNASPVAKIASAIIMDMCYPSWRQKAQPEVLGAVVERNDPAVLKWRKLVLDRDKRTCQACGGTKRLHAHHILRWIDYPAARLLVDNGITYCQPCHATVPQGGLCG